MILLFVATYITLLIVIGGLSTHVDSRLAERVYTFLLFGLGIPFALLVIMTGFQGLFYEMINFIKNS